MKTVFILGAGASRAAGGPLMADFIAKASRVKSRGEARWAKSYFDASLSAREKLQRAFVKSTVDLDNIESLFATYEMASLVGRLSSLTDHEAESLPKSLRFLIMRTLEQSIQYKLDSNKDIIASPYPYESFVRLLLELQKSDYVSPIAVINFNYDLCLDYALHLRDYPSHYGLVGEKPKFSNSIAHYKVHGSLNWIRDETHGTIKPQALKTLWTRTYLNRLGPMARDMQAIDTMELLRGPDAWGEGLIPEPVIVPPTWNKGWYQEQLKSVWRNASDALSTAENIFVIGYSLPPSDQFFRAFWALSSISDNVVEKFWLFDPAPGDEVQNRFSSMLGPAIISRGKFQHERVKFTEAIRHIAEYFDIDGFDRLTD